MGPVGFGFLGETFLNIAGKETKIPLFSSRCPTHLNRFIIPALFVATF